jgi:hypothetical protein
VTFDWPNLLAGFALGSAVTILVSSIFYRMQKRDAAESQKQLIGMFSDLITAKLAGKKIEVDVNQVGLITGGRIIVVPGEPIPLTLRGYAPVVTVEPAPEKKG